MTACSCRYNTVMKLIFILSSLAIIYYMRVHKVPFAVLLVAQLMCESAACAHAPLAWLMHLLQCT